MFSSSKIDKVESGEVTGRYGSDLQGIGQPGEIVRWCELFLTGASDV
jgi:hypothetical protein